MLKFSKYSNLISACKMRILSVVRLKNNKRFDTMNYIRYDKMYVTVLFELITNTDMIKISRVMTVHTIRTTRKT